MYFRAKDINRDELGDLVEDLENLQNKTLTLEQERRKNQLNYAFAELDEIPEDTVSYTSPAKEESDFDIIEEDTENFVFFPSSPNAEPNIKTTDDYVDEMLLDF